MKENKKNIKAKTKNKSNNRDDKVQVWIKKKTLEYDKELASLQVELLKFQNHVKDKGLKIMVKNTKKL